VQRDVLCLSSHMCPLHLWKDSKSRAKEKKATKAGKREIFGKMQIVKAKPAKTVVKAYPVAALKKSI